MILLLLAVPFNALIVVFFELLKGSRMSHTMALKTFAVPCAVSISLNRIIAEPDAVVAALEVTLEPSPVSSCRE